MRTCLVFIILSLLGAPVLGRHDASKVVLTIIEPVGHRQSFRSVAIPAPHGLIIRYRYDCRRIPARMTVIVAWDTVGYDRISKRDVVARFQTPTSAQRSGTITTRHGGRYRLAVSLLPRCSWSMRLFG